MDDLSAFDKRKPKPMRRSPRSKSTVAVEEASVPVWAREAHKSPVSLRLKARIQSGLCSARKTDTISLVLIVAIIQRRTFQHSTAIEIFLNTFQDVVDELMRVQMPLIQTTLHFGKFFREMGSTAQ
jgi:hypothetical protein